MPGSHLQRHWCCCIHIDYLFIFAVVLLLSLLCLQHSFFSTPWFTIIVNMIFFVTYLVASPNTAGPFLAIQLFLHSKTIHIIPLLYLRFRSRGYAFLPNVCFLNSLSIIITNVWDVTAVLADFNFIYTSLLSILHCFWLLCSYFATVLSFSIFTVLCWLHFFHFKWQEN